MRPSAGTSIILASTSPYRHKLLKRLKMPFKTINPNVKETTIVNEPPDRRALRLATVKAQTVFATNALVIGSDQVAVCEGTILHKPLTASRARAQLRACSGKVVTFFTAVSVRSTSSEKQEEQVVPCEVEFRILRDEEINCYIALDNPLYCAGSFKWESLGITLFGRINTEDPTSLEGLPLIALSRILREFGLRIPGPTQVTEY